MSKKAKQEAAPLAEAEVVGKETPEEKAEAKRQQALSVAGAKGFALAEKYYDTAVGALQKVLGDKVVVTDTGLQLAKDATLDEKSSASLIAALAETSEKEATVRSTIQCSLGDAVLAVREQLGGDAADALIEQVVSERGSSKHSVQECPRVMDWVNDIWEFSERPKGLTFTHLQEGKNASRSRDGKVLIPKAKVKAIFAKAAEGDVVNGGKKGDGDEFEQRKPWSTAKLREALMAARPEEEQNKKSPKKKAEKAESSGGGEEGDAEYVASKGFLYIKDYDTVHWSEDLDESAIKGGVGSGEDDAWWMVIDLDNRVLLNKKGKKLADITDLPTEAAAEEVVDLP